MTLKKVLFYAIHTMKGSPWILPLNSQPPVWREHLAPTIGRVAQNTNPKSLTT